MSNERFANRKKNAKTQVEAIFENSNFSSKTFPDLSKSDVIPVMRITGISGPSEAIEEHVLIQGLIHITRAMNSIYRALHINELDNSKFNQPLVTWDFSPLSEENGYFLARDENGDLGFPMCWIHIAHGNGDGTITPSLNDEETKLSPRMICDISRKMAGNRGKVVLAFLPLCYPNDWKTPFEEMEEISILVAEERIVREDDTMYEDQGSTFNIEIAGWSMGFEKFEQETKILHEQSIINWGGRIQTKLRDC